VAVYLDNSTDKWGIRWCTGYLSDVADKAMQKPKLNEHGSGNSGDVPKPEDK
jgi:hypothetical protein